MWRFSSFIVLILISITKLGVHAHPLVPCFFIFGDSLSDPGNNNRLKTKAKANYRPYGIDIPGRKPTGRFSNGLTAVDVIAERLGFHRRIPPFSSTKGHDILKGVNYASGAAGIRPETGQHLGDIVSFDKQLRNHKRLISRLNTKLNGSTQAQAHLKKCLFTTIIGSNDYINNYFMPEHYSTGRNYTYDSYAHSLISLYRRNLQTLYRNGARKVAVFGLGLVGCTLGQVIQNRPHSLCVDKVNIAVLLMNDKLKTLVAELNRKYRDAKFTYINLQGMVIGPQNGITVLNRPCCQLREDFQCKASSAICNNRNTYYFWDGYHPTEAVHKIVGSRAFKSINPIEAYPFDILTLVKQKL
ncbi:GDSL esterase/lipase At5g45670-like [Chenopodium quinoa]|uniref:GDSL esterase/lipase At5g45670-like n=1 Tax=Chenopodium quinoa TaxID=63459 RepID=UPI000B777445|nr:GDSL esterase/lipase At5g45670-like [Chenopodium quinoa]